ncbi:MAG: hypothetical protein KC731_42410 [Myxococcales bacterium]|nr:hypothetical protein [Myxococcales bacterium]
MSPVRRVSRSALALVSVLAAILTAACGPATGPHQSPHTQRHGHPHCHDRPLLGDTEAKCHDHRHGPGHH